MLTREKPRGSTGWKTPSRTWTEVLVILLAAAFVTFLVWFLLGRNFDLLQGWSGRVALIVFGAGAIYLSFRRERHDGSLAETQEKLRRALDSSPHHPDKIDPKRYARDDDGRSGDGGAG